MQSIDTAAVERFRRGLTLAPSGCIEWTGSKDPSGYGRIGIAGVRHRTHRLAWELVHGPIPEGIQVLHRCDNRPCCNVEHLFLGTNAVNMADRDAKGRHANQRKTHCPAGHEYNAENTYYAARGSRNCRVCKRIRKAEAKRNRAA
jgi:HNH endonuclease